MAERISTVYVGNNIYRDNKGFYYIAKLNAKEYINYKGNGCPIL